MVASLRNQFLQALMGAPERAPFLFPPKISPNCQGTGASKSQLLGADLAKIREAPAGLRVSKLRPRPSLSSSCDFGAVGHGFLRPQHRISRSGQSGFSRSHPCTSHSRTSHRDGISQACRRVAFNLSEMTPQGNRAEVLPAGRHTRYRIADLTNLSPATFGKGVHECLPDRMACINGTDTTTSNGRISTGIGTNRPPARGTTPRLG